MAWFGAIGKALQENTPGLPAFFQRWSSFLRQLVDRKTPQNYFAHQFEAGGFNPLEKYESQIGSSSQL